MIRQPPANAWKKGESGNAAGRPRGIPNPSTRLRQMIDTAAIIERLQTAALAGDVTAARTLLERALPVHRSTAEPVTLPELEAAERLTDKAKAVLSAIANGRLPPDVGSSLLTSLSTVSKILEIDELARRVATLEARNHAKD
jgi:hypothetical protein